MKKLAIAFIFTALSLLAGAEEKSLHYTLISPPLYAEDWQSYLDMRAELRPDVDFKLANTAVIYDDYPFDPAAVDGAPRNPAESIHAWIREQMAGITDSTERAKYYFVLGGSFTDAQTITTSDDERLKRYIPGVYVRPRFSPDANIQVGEPYYSISDMFYACLDVKEGEWPWDANKNGKYADNQESGTTMNDYIADVIVSRIPVEKHSSGAKSVIAAFKEKVARVENPAFAGCYRFALAGGQCSNKDGRINVSDSRTLRDEHEFYDGGLNMFDPRHGGIWVDSELVPRQTVKNTTVNSRPVLEGNPMFMYTWGAEHPLIDEAVAHFYSHDYDYMEYRDHGSASDLYCKYINADAYLKATGLTRMIISGFSCMTGYIDGPGISLAEAEILSPQGGTVASVHNSRYGVNWAGTDLKDNAGLSSTLQYLTKQGVLEKNIDIGQAWLYARQKFAASDGLGLFVSMEQLLLGDPLIKLSPSIPETTLDTTQIDVDKDMGYTTLNVKGDTTISGDYLFKVMQGLNVTSSGDLTFAADGGVGGSGVVFEKGNGILTIASPTKSYFVQPTGAREVVLAGNGTTLDFEQATPKFSKLTLVGEGERKTGNVLRGSTVGQLKGFVPFVIENTEVALGTVDVLNGASGTNLASVKNGGLGIIFNPNYGLENSWEYLAGSVSLDDGALFVDRTTTAGFGRPDKPGLAVSVSGNSSVKTMNGGKATLFGASTFNLADGATLNLDATLVPDSETDGKLVINKGKTIVANEVGLRGEVIVSGGTLELTKIPLVNVTKLTLLSDSKLILPYDEGGFYQILENGATLELNDAKIYSSDNLDEPIVGELTTTCAFFDASKFLVWNNKGGGNWNLASNNQPWKRGNDKVAYTAGMKVCFPDIAYSAVNQVHAIDLTEELNCEYAYFGNATQKYKFTGEKLNLQNLQVGTDVEFANEVYAPRGTIAAEGAKLTVANLTTPTLDITGGAVVECSKLGATIETIKGIRFVILGSKGGGGTVALSELRFFNKDGKLDVNNESIASISSPVEIGDTSTLFDNKYTDWDNMGGAENWKISVDPSDFDAGRCYLEFSLKQPTPMITAYGVASPFSSSRNPPPTQWRVQVTVDNESWVTVDTNFGSYETGGGSHWYNGGESAFKISNIKTLISVAKDGVLMMNGNIDADINLAEGAILKAVKGEGSLTLGKGSKLVLPTEGVAVIDCSDVELTDPSTTCTILSGVSLTEAELDHLTTRGKPWMKLELNDGALTLRLDKKPPKVLFR